MTTVLHDGLPRNITYPVTTKFLSEELNGVVNPDDLGLYFLYISGLQLDHYDPLISAEEKYPVMVLDNMPPPLNGNVIAHLAEAQAASQRKPDAWPKESALQGAQRAQAQLAGEERVLGQAPEEVRKRPEVELPSVSILILPVKVRVRPKVTEAIASQGMRAIKNWLSCPPDRKPSQRPLVLTYDEASGRLTSKFATDWNDTSKPRIYF